MCQQKEAIHCFFPCNLALVCFFQLISVSVENCLGASAVAQPKSGKFNNRCSPSAIIMEVRVTTAMYNKDVQSPSYI